MGATASINVPLWQVDDDQSPQHRFANDKTRQALKAKLLAGDYSALIEASEVNPMLREGIISLIGSRNFDSELERDTDVDQLEVHPLNKRQTGVELLVTVATRLRNQNVYNYFAVVLSILALACGVPVLFWSLLTGMGLLFSRVWTIKLAQEIGDEVAASKPEGSSSNLGLAIADNKAYFIRTAFVHAEEIEGVTQLPRKANGEFLHTVNNIQVPIVMPGGVDVDLRRGEWSSDASSVGIIDLIVNFDCPLFLNLQCWQHFLTVHQSGDCILHHPFYDPNGSHFAIYDPAIIDISTSAYIENIQILETLQALHVDGGKNSFKNVLYVGDQQTYDRTCVLIQQRPAQFSWVIPLNGDFHFAAHTAACVNDLYYLPLGCWAVSKIGFEKVVKEKDDNIANFKHYDHFYLLLTLSIVIVLSETIDMAILSFPGALLEQVKNNAGAQILVRFLFEAGLPYLTLRTAIRSNNAGVINSMYMYMINPFRATNKYLYAKLCVYNLHTYYILKPELRDIWDRERTASLRGHVGRNVGWDFALERMNLEVQTLLGSNISAERIQECIRQLNGIRHIRAPALDAFGIGDADLSEYNGILESDVQALVHKIKEALKFDGIDDAGKLLGPSQSNPFRSPGSKTPWGRIAQAETRESKHAYVTRTVRSAPRNTMG